MTILSDIHSDPKLARQQLYECTSRLWTVRSFLTVLHSAVLYDQQNLVKNSPEILYDDVIKHVLDELLEIASAVGEVESVLERGFKPISSDS